MGTIAEQLFDDYNDYRRDTGHIQRLKQSQRYIPSISRKHLPRFEELAHWCKEQGVEPRRWLASLFECRRWLFPPRLNQLKSTRHLERYPTMSSIPVFQGRVRREHQEAARVSGRVFDRSRDLATGAELLKRRYIAWGNYERCMSEMETDTFGYHPRSEVCQNCQARYQCAAILQSKVNYDIMALRLGLMTTEEARTVAYYGSSK